MGLVTFKFREDLLTQLWQDYELKLGVEDVIVAIKNVKTKMDFIMVLGKIGEAFKKTEGFGIEFLTSEATREDIAERLDGVFEFGGTVGALVIEPFDKKAFKTALDWAAEEVEVEEG